MKRYRRKPSPTFEAVQITDAHFDDDHPSDLHLPGIVYDPVNRCALVYPSWPPVAGTELVGVPVGDWLIRDHDGSYRRANDEVFRATYEEVERD